MNDPLKNIRDEAKKIRLSHDEKAYMRVQIFNIIERKNAQVPAYHPTRTPYFFFAPRFAMPFAAFLLLTFGTTTTYAAQGALPGNFLYPVKIYVNENIQGVLAFSDEAKVSYHTEVAEERLKEAEALASQGKLDASTTLALEANFTEHASKADEIATELEEEEENSTGVEAKIALNSSLAAHSAILSHIGEWSEDKQTKENSFNIADNARSRGLGLIVALKVAAPIAQTMAFSAVEATSDVATSGSSNNNDANVRSVSKDQASTTQAETKQKKITLQLQGKATSQLAQTQATFNGSKSGLNASTTQKVKAQLSALSDLLAAGRGEVKADNYATARVTFTEVLRSSIELKTFIEASKTYNQDLKHSWWGDNEGVVKGAETQKGKSDDHDIKIDLHL